MYYIKNSESGRSILEILFVIAIITLLTIGGLFGGKAVIINTKAQAINKHMVSMVNQRRLSMAALKNQAAKRTEQAPYGTLLTVENGTEGNHPDDFWISGTFSPSDLYEKVVDLGAQTLNPDKVETETDQTESGAVKAKFFFKKYPTSNAAVHPEDPTPSSPEEPGIEPEEPEIEPEASVCTTDTDCAAGTLCVSGECSGTCVSGASCNSCSDDKPYWNDDIGCVECSDDSCGSGKYCTDSGACATCTPPTEEICSGTPATDSYGCPTQTLISCSGTTPVCDNGRCICPLGAASCSSEGTITCNPGYYLDGDTCATCGAGYILNKEGTGCVAEQSCSASNDTCGEGYYCHTTTNKCAVNTCTIEHSSPVVNGTQIGTTGCYCVAGYIVNAAGNGCVAETTCTSDTDCSEGYYCNTTTNKCEVNTCTIENSSPVVNGTQIGTTGCYCVAGYIVNAAGNGCVENNSNCPTGTTWDGTGTAATALENGHCICTSYSENQCGTGYYCNISSATICSPNNDGRCQKITETELNNGYSSDKMNWWSAYSFCKGFPGNKSMPTLAKLDIKEPNQQVPNRYCYFPDHYLHNGYYNAGVFERDEDKACKSASGITMTPDNSYAAKSADLEAKYPVDQFWTQDQDPEEPCVVFYVEPYLGVNTKPRGYGYYAVCE